MKQRKKQPVQTKQAIFEAVAVEFGAHGYSGAGLGAIVSRAGLTKGALFHHFPDKRALAMAWIKEPLAAEMDARWITPLEAISSLDGLKSFCRSRCLELRADDAVSTLTLLAAETAVADPALGDALESVFAAWRDALSALLERGKTGGWIHRAIQAPVEAAFLVSAFSGFTVSTKCRPDDHTRRTCAEALEGYLETLRAQ